MRFLLLDSDFAAGPAPEPAVEFDNVTLPQARRLVYQRWLDEWVTPGGNPVTTFDNEAFSEPPATSWVWLRVRHPTPGEQWTLGPPGRRKFRRRAICEVQIRCPVDRGLAELDGHAQRARAIFEGVQLAGGLRFLDVSTRELGSDGRWYTTVVEAELEYYETK